MDTNNTEKSWTEKYRPADWSSIQGHNKDLKKIRRWAESWSAGDDAILLVGPPGVGKTTTAKVASEEMGYPMQEINASTARKTADIEEIAGNAVGSPMDADHQLILLDEVDGWPTGANAPDRTPLFPVLDDPPNPIILTANDKYDIPQSIKRRVRIMDFSLGKRSRKAKLREIAEKEDVEIDSEDLSTLAERPDLRSAINDLQTWAEQDVPPSSGDRTYEAGEFDVVEDILRGNPDLGFSSATPEDMVIWMDENVKKEYRGLEATMAYDCLRRADKFAGYAQQTRNYRYWKYASSLIEQVARVRLTDTHDYYIDLDFPEWFRSSTPSPSSDSATARVYRKLKDKEDGTFQFGGGYTYFRRVLLPLIRKTPTEKRKQLALDNQFESDEAEVIGLSTEDFDRWTDDEVPEERQEESVSIKQSSAMEW